MEILAHMAREGFEQVAAIHDRRSGLRGYLALHDGRLGPAFGGVRRSAYRNERGALSDCLHLALAMAHKCALAGLPAGGGKVVLLERPGVDWERAYEHVGELVEGLGGRFRTGPDVGTSARELAWIARRTRHVTRPDEAGPGELAEATAEGVFRGIGAALVHLDGEEDWERRRVVVQGLGEVGRRLASRLMGAGATVLASEIVPERAQQVCAELGLESIPPSREYGLACDVLAPCALGGIVHDLTLARLSCRVLAGGANNVLARPQAGDLLHRRGVLYVPDVLVSAGALLRGALFTLEGRRVPIFEIGDRIGTATARLLAEAAAQDRSPARYAIEEAERRIRQRRGA